MIPEERRDGPGAGESTQLQTAGSDRQVGAPAGPGRAEGGRRAAEPALLLPSERKAGLRGGTLPHLARPGRQAGRTAGETEARRRARARVVGPRWLLLPVPGHGSRAGKRPQAPPVRPRNGGRGASPARRLLDAPGSLLRRCRALGCDGRGPRVCSCACHSFPSFPFHSRAPGLYSFAPGQPALYLIKF